MSAIPEPVGRFTLVDLGSGKGRVLLLAVQRGVGRAVGVEFAEELHHDAEQNLARAALPWKDRVTLVLGDAGSFEPPPGPLVVHLNNPFHEPVMERVIARLADSYARNPRPVIVVYQQHRHEPPRTRTDNVALLEDVPFLERRHLAHPHAIDRLWLLQPWLVDVFESPEVAELRAGRGTGRRRSRVGAEGIEPPTTSL